MEPTQDQNAPSAETAAGVKPAAAPRSKFYRVAWGIFAVIMIVIGVSQIVGGISSFVNLPGCDSQDAKDRLSNVFKERNYAPLRYDSIKTISTGKDQVICNAVLPLPDGVNLVADYNFYWEGRSSMMKYSIHRAMP